MDASCAPSNANAAKGLADHLVSARRPGDEILQGQGSSSSLGGPLQVGQFVCAAFKTVNAANQSRPMMGRQVAMTQNAAQFSNQFFAPSAGPAAVPAGPTGLVVPGALLPARQIPAAAQNWVQEFNVAPGASSSSRIPAHGNPDFEAAFASARAGAQNAGPRAMSLNPGPAWNAEFMRMQQMAHPAVRAHQHHDAAFEHEWHSQFDSIAGDAKGKAAAPTASTQQQQQQQYPAQHVHGDLDAWSEEFAKVNLSDTGALADWQREFENFDLEGVTDEREREELMNKMAEVWRELQKQNEEIDARGAAAGSDLANPWDGGYEDFLNRNENGAFSDPDPVTAPWTEYKFEPNNPFLGRPDALEMGLQILQSPDGSLSQAALAFEAAVQANHANNSDAWMHLGKVQAENEKEDAAIIALQKSVQLNPQNLPALMSLAVSYTNEGKEFQAYATLNRWLTTKYPSIPEAAQPQAPLSQAGGGGAFMSSYEVHDATTARYLQAVQTSLGGGGGVPGVGVDADLQLGLGVLFYNRGEFDKVIDCFSAALRVRADDYLLWNRLGATLANSGRSEEAIEAYRKALELKPSFVRCRYNLGVSCINIGCYREAAEHLLGALSLHNVGDDEAAAVNVSENLWDTLRRAFVQMRRMDLADMADKNRNVDQFRKEFEF